MKIRALVISGFVFLLGMSGYAVAGHEVIFGPERTVINPFVVDDYGDCTDEILRWNAVLTSFDFVHVSGNGDNQTFHVVSHFQWTAVVTGLTTGYVWETTGGGKDSVKSDASDGLPYKEVFIENSVLKPVTAGAPRIRFHALLRMREDGEGNLVTDSLDYEYHCIGKK